MATAAIKIKIMPEGLDTDLEAIKVEGTVKIAAEKGVIAHYDIEPVAFGLNSLIATLAWPEEKETEIVEKIFLSIAGVSSVDIIDYRRALG